MPLLLTGQAQKETTHNEALALIDLALHAAVEAVGVDAPPGDPGEGDSWVVGDAPSGPWAGQARALAGWTDGGWRFVAPREGLAVWDKASAREARFAGGAWAVGTAAVTRVTVDGSQVVGARLAAIADPDGGTTMDAEARTTISAILAALRTHGLIAA